MVFVAGRLRRLASCRRHLFVAYGDDVANADGAVLQPPFGGNNDVYTDDYHVIQHDRAIGVAMSRETSDHRHLCRHGVMRP